MPEPTRVLPRDLGPCTVRPWHRDDAGALAHHANDARIARNLRDQFPHPYTRDAARAYLAYATAQDPPTSFAIVVDGAAVGGIGLRLQDDVERVSAEVGYWLAVPFWGRGLTTAALHAVSEHAFAAHPALTRLYAVPFAWNAASMRVLARCGFVREGVMRRAAIKEGVIVDQHLWALLREEWTPA